eukprot:jgi/Tetstr1/464189/TSEL_008994.t1
MTDHDDTLRWLCEERPEMSDADQEALQRMLDEHPPRFAPDVRDVLRWRLRAHFEHFAAKGNARSAAAARLCLLRFDATDVVTLQRCAAGMTA